MKDIFYLDRFEGRFAVLEDENGKIIQAEKSLLSPTAKEGDVLIRANDGKYSPDQKLTAERRAKLKKIEDRLFE